MLSPVISSSSLSSIMSSVACVAALHSVLCLQPVCLYRSARVPGSYRPTHACYQDSSHLHRESKKRRHYTLVHIFAKYWPIFTILLPTYSVGTVQ